MQRVAFGIGHFEIAIEEQGGGRKGNFDEEGVEAGGGVGG